MFFWHGMQLKIVSIRSYFKYRYRIHSESSDSGADSGRKGIVMARWQSGYAADCNSVNAGSIPTRASILNSQRWPSDDAYCKRVMWMVRRHDMRRLGPI